MVPVGSFLRDCLKAFNIIIHYFCTGYNINNNLIGQIILYLKTSLGFFHFNVRQQGVNI